MDGQFDKLEELIYVESHLSNTSSKFYGEITQQMLKNTSFPGSNNGTGLLQVCVWGGGGGLGGRGRFVVGGGLRAVSAVILLDTAARLQLRQGSHR
jgi:hypothetical protein